jgi:hypothetical protein
MKHFDSGNYDERVNAIQSSHAKEASAVQAVGYLPSAHISDREWNEMVARDKRTYDENGYYHYDPDDVYRGEQYNPRYLMK